MLFSSTLFSISEAELYYFAHWTPICCNSEKRGFDMRFTVFFGHRTFCKRKKNRASKAVTVPNYCLKFIKIGFQF